MIQEKPFTIFEISRELNTGSAFTKFLLKRFGRFLSPDTSEGQPIYSSNDVSLLLKIKHSLDSGTLPSQVEQDLDTPESPEMSGLAEQFLANANEDVRISKDGLRLIKSLFSDISEQQKRIAAAHEKRAEAEERKAVAIEKRAEAEEKKASAMNNIAIALQEMNRLKIQDPETMRIVHHASSILDPDNGLLEDLGSDFGRDRDDSDQENGLDDLSSLLDSDEIDGESMIVEPVEIDDADGLVQDGEEPGIEENGVQIGDDLSRLLEDDQTLEFSSLETDAADDLNQLIDTVSREDREPESQDDLSLLIREEPDGLLDVDDLSLLVEEENREQFPDLDDLSLLIDPDASPGPDMDNLSLLLDSGEAPLPATSPGPTDMDNLSLLIEDEEKITVDLSKEDPELGMDDLSLLLDKEASLKPDISPQDDIEAYKAEVMKIIIQLKTNGSSAQETAQRLNRDAVPTLSGKPEWSVKALEQIYKFIDSAK